MQKVVVHKHVWSSSGIFFCRAVEKLKKYTILFRTSTPESSSHEDDKNSIFGRPHLFSGRH